MAKKINEKQNVNEDMKTEPKVLSGPVLKGSALGPFLHSIWEKLRNTAQQERDKIPEDTSGINKALIHAKADVYEGLVKRLTNYFETGVNREVLFEVLLDVLKNKKRINLPRQTKPQSTIKAFEGARENLDRYFAPADDTKVFGASEKGYVSRAFNAQAKSGDHPEEVFRWMESIYRELTDLFDTVWELQYNSAIQHAIPQPEDVIGLESDKRYPRPKP